MDMPNYKYPRYFAGAGSSDSPEYSTPSTQYANPAVGSYQPDFVPASSNYAQQEDGGLFANFGRQAEDETVVLNNYGAEKSADADKYFTDMGGSRSYSNLFSVTRSYSNLFSTAGPRAVDRAERVS